MQIRRWVYSDIKVIEQLEKDHFIDPWNFTMLSDTFTTDNFYGYVAEENGGIVGYIGCIFFFDEAEIVMVCTKMDYQRKGIATKLLDQLCKFLNDNAVKFIYLEVRRSNFKAQKCYIKEGFTVEGVRKLYYQNTEDAILMKKVL